MACLPSPLLPHRLIVLVSGSTDRARQQASGIAGLAILRVEMLAAPVGSFYFPGKLSGGPDTLWMKPTRPIWLTAFGVWHELAGTIFLFFTGG